MKMIKDFGKSFLSLVIFLICLFTAQTAFSATFDYYSLPTGTILKVESLNSLNSKTAEKGNTLEAVVTETIYRDEVALIPSGTKVFGKVISVEKAETNRKNGLLAVEFTELKFADGTNRRLNGELADRFDYADLLPPFHIISLKNIKAIDGGKSLELGKSSIEFISKFFETEREKVLAVKENMFSKGFEAELTQGEDFLVKINHRLTIPVAR